jgi:hypothetical protein
MYYRSCLWLYLNLRLMYIGVNGHINVKIDALFSMLRRVKVSLYVTCIIGRFCGRKWTCKLYINEKIEMIFYMLRSVKVSLYLICIIGRFCGRT